LVAAGLVVGLPIAQTNPAAAAHRIAQQAQDGSEQATDAQRSQQERPRVAILNFDFSSISNPQLLSFIKGGASGVSDILISKLVKKTDYRVIERSRVETILAEQNLGQSGRIDSSTAAKIGKVLGVEAVVFGSVNQFDLQKQESGGGLFGIAANVEEEDAFVGLNYRVVSTKTAEIITAGEGSGKASQSDTQVSVFGIGSAGSDTENQTKLLTLATEQALNDVVKSLQNNYDKLASLGPALPTTEALVAEVTNGKVVLDRGSGDRYREGMIVSIERVTNEVTDPKTGKVIRRMTDSVARVKLTEVDRQSSVGKIVSGRPPQRGDIAKPVEQ